MNTFPKSEKLCGQLRIAALYKSGRRFVTFPIRVSYRSATGVDSGRGTGVPEPPKVLIWAPKSLFKHAVDRNRLRRLMREAYRLNNQPLLDFCAEKGINLQLAFNYIDKEMRSQEEISAAMQKAIRKLIQQLSE